MTRLGADATSTNVAALRVLGATFVSRYLSDYPWKNLTPAEAQALSDAGFDLVSNWENDVNDWASGQGAAFARRAVAQHAACGGPDWAPIYFSVDELVDPSDPRLHQYFKEINAEIGLARTGCYAQTSVLRALRSAGLIRFTWRSMSTFGLPEGLGDPGEFDVEQTGQFDTDYDRDVANSAYFGQWRIGAPAPQGALMILDQASIDAVVQSLLDHPIPRSGAGEAGTTTLGALAAWMDAHIQGLSDEEAAIAAAVAKLAAQMDPKTLAASLAVAVQPAITQAVASGIAPEADQLALTFERHLAATLTLGK